MRLFRSLQVVGSAFVMMFFPALRALAQTADPQPSRRWALGASADAGSMANTFGSRCGGSEPSYGYSGSLLYRPTAWLVFEGAVHRAKVLGISACDLLLPLYKTGPNQFETRDTTFTAPHAPLTEGFLRAGVETPPTMPLLRASIGLGQIWHSSLPVGSFAVGMGTRGAGVRFYGEVETFVTRLHGLEHHHPFEADSTGETPLAEYSIRRTLVPRWSTLHLGVEFPIASARATRNAGTEEVQ